MSSKELKFVSGCDIIKLTIQINGQSAYLDRNAVKMIELMNDLQITTVSVGMLKAGGIITFAAWYPWYLKLWYHLRYMRHSNPMLKSKRQFIIL